MKKNILITGSTDGIGKLVALRFAKEGHTIYLHGRSQSKVDGVIAELVASSGNDSIQGFVADFSDLESVKVMAAKILAEVPKIDVLINNAGVFKSPVNYNKDGIDIRLVVNFLAPYQLTTALLPLLKNSEAARIVNLSSAAQAPVSLDALKGQEELSVSTAYAQSKLALTMWSFYLAKKEESIAVVAVNPGSLLNTKMANEAYGQYWSSADKGSNILYDLAVKWNAADINGKYFDNDNGGFGRAYPDAYDENKINELNKVALNLLKN